MFVVILLLRFSSTVFALDTKVDVGELWDEFYSVANLGEVIDLLDERLKDGDEDVERIVRYMNSTDFRNINDHMWKWKDSQSVRRSNQSPKIY